MQVLMRKTKFAFPVKIHGENFTDKKLAEAIQEATESCCHFLIGGGKEFMLPIAMTESFPIKDSVKNVLHGLLAAVSIIIFSQEAHHNCVEEVSLETTKSIALPIFSKEDLEEDE